MRACSYFVITAEVGAHILTAARSRPVSMHFLPPRTRGGGAPKGANLMVSAVLLEPRRAPAGAPHTRSSSEAVAHRKYRHTPRACERACSFAASLIGIGPRFRLVLPRSNGARGQVVSQLLTGTRRVVPGGSPDAARVPSLRSQARGRRPPSRLTTPHDAPLRGRGDRIVREVRRCGTRSGIGATKRHLSSPT